MTPKIPCLIALLAAGSALAAGSTISTSSGDKHAFSATVSAGGVHEECVKLAKDESRRYEWSSNAAVDFNIHYHEGAEVTYPVKRDGMRTDGGTFTASKGTQDYCWMWTARDKPVKLEGRIESK